MRKGGRGKVALVFLMGFARLCYAPHAEPPKQQIVFPASDDSQLEAETLRHWRNFQGDCGVEISRTVWELDNKRFYEKLSQRQFSDRTMACGMDMYPDLRVPRMQNLLGVGEARANSPQILVEVGGGMGRVIDYLIKNTQIPLIISVERSQRYAVRLRDRMRSVNTEAGYNRVVVFSTNLLKYLQSSEERDIVDVVTWMWWGFAEVHPTEKLTALQQLQKVVRPGGTIVIDLPTSDIVPTEVTEYHNNFIDIRMSKAADAPTLHLHRFSIHVLKKLAREAGLTPSGCEEYTARSHPNPTRRALCFFNKPHTVN